MSAKRKGMNDEDRELILGIGCATPECPTDRTAAERRKIKESRRPIGFVWFNDKDQEADSPKRTPRKPRKPAAKRKTKRTK